MDDNDCNVDDDDGDVDDEDDDVDDDDNDVDDDGNDVDGNDDDFVDKLQSHTTIVAKKRDPGILDPKLFWPKLGKLRQD